MCEAMDKAEQRGREKERVSQITSMLKDGKTVEQIVDFCKYPLELVKGIAEELQ